MIYKSKESKARVSEAAKRGRQTVKKQTDERIKTYYENPKKCLFCGKRVDYYKKTRCDFCGRSCSAKYRIANDIKNGVVYTHSHTTIKEKSCENCRKMFKGWSQGAKYCSENCAREKRNSELVDKIEKDETVSQKCLRNYLMDKYKGKCQQCKWGEPNPTSGTVCLDMHHVDGDSKNTRLSNVKLLCPNCHSLTTNYKRCNQKHKSARTSRK